MALSRKRNLCNSPSRRAVPRDRGEREEIPVSCRLPRRASDPGRGRHPCLPLQATARPKVHKHERSSDIQLFARPGGPVHRGESGPEALRGRALVLGIDRRRNDPPDRPDRGVSRGFPRPTLRGLGKAETRDDGDAPHEEINDCRHNRVGCGRRTGRSRGGQKVQDVMVEEEPGAHVAEPQEKPLAKGRKSRPPIINRHVPSQRPCAALLLS